MSPLATRSFIIILVFLASVIANCSSAEPSSSQLHSSIFQRKEDAIVFIAMFKYFTLKGDGNTIKRMVNWYHKRVGMIRYRRCVRKLGIESICENKLGYSLWIRSLADHILSEKVDLY